MVDDFTPIPGHDDVFGGFAAIKANGAVHDLLVLGTGLLLIADPDRSGPGIPRLNHLLASTPTADLVGRHWFIPYGDITRARIVKRTPIRVDLDLADGRQVSIAAGWTTPLLTKQSDKALIDLLTTRPVAYPTSPGAQPGPHTGAPVPEPGSFAAAAGPRRLYRDGCDIATANVLDALANIAVNDAAYDLIVLDVGLVLVADPGPVEDGRERLTRLVRTVPAYAIAARNWLIRYEEVVHARITKQIPLRAEVGLYDGRQLAIKEPWTTQNLTDEGRTTLAQALVSVGASTD